MILVTGVDVYFIEYGEWHHGDLHEVRGAPDVWVLRVNNNRIANMLDSRDNIYVDSTECRFDAYAAHSTLVVAKSDCVVSKGLQARIDHNRSLGGGVR